MTTIALLYHQDKKHLVGVDVFGHAGYAPLDTDIVCAAVTDAIRFLDCLLRDELGLDTHPILEEETARICLRLTEADALESSAQLILKGYVRHMTALADEYPRYVRISR